MSSERHRRGGNTTSSTPLDALLSTSTSSAFAKGGGSQAQRLSSIEIERLASVLSRGIKQPKDTKSRNATHHVRSHLDHHCEPSAEAAEAASPSSPLGRNDDGGAAATILAAADGEECTTYPAAAASGSSYPQVVDQSSMTQVVDHSRQGSDILLRYSLACEALRELRTSGPPSLAEYHTEERQAKQRRPYTAGAIRPSTASHFAGAEAAAASRRVVGRTADPTPPPMVLGQSLSMIMNQQPLSRAAAAATVAEAEKSIPAPRRPQSAPTAAAGARGFSASRRPLSGKIRPSRVSNSDQRVVDRLMQTHDTNGDENEGDVGRHGDNDADMNIVVDDDGDEDAELEGLTYSNNAHAGKRSRPPTAQRPVSAKAAPPSQQAAAIDNAPLQSGSSCGGDNKHHVLGTAEMTIVRATVPPPSPLYFSTFRCSGISDFLHTQKVQTFGVYREKLQRYLRERQGGGGGGGSDGGAAASSSAFGRQQHIPTKSEFQMLVEARAAAVQKKRQEMDDAAPAAAGVPRGTESAMPHHHHHHHHHHRFHPVSATGGSGDDGAMYASSSSRRAGPLRAVRGAVNNW